MRPEFKFNIPQTSFSMNSSKALIIALVVTGLVAGINDYVSLPAYNLHDMSFIFLMAFYLIVFAFVYVIFSQKPNAIFTFPIVAAILMVITSIFLSVLGSEILNSAKYREQIVITEQNEFKGNFTLVNLDQVPLVDKATAQQLGDKQIGKVQGLGSQFNINQEYTLVSSNEQIYRVSPLEHQDFFKWFQNRISGIPGYIQVNVTDPNDVSLVDLTQGIIYSPSAFFDQDLLRHVRFTYRTEILQDFSFEIDDTGHPFYVISVIEPEIGWFTGWDTQAVIIVDAVSGAMDKYALEDLPNWVDRAQPTDLAWSQIDNWGYYVHGYWNTIFGQKDMIQTTDGYNYVSIEGQTYIFSGLTSVGADRSIVGFALINLRTKEARFIKVGGADEYSAMSSAQGQVQDLNYEATFPVLLNIESKATYFMSLKDNEGLVKLYAMVNVQDYSIVGVGESLAETKEAYITKLRSSGMVEAPVVESTELTGTIQTIKSAILQGTTQYYIILEGNPQLYVASAELSVELMLSEVGDVVRLEIATEDLDTLNLKSFDNLNYNY